MSEKTHDPTPTRLREARQKGQVPLSRELIKCAIVLPLIEAAFAMEESWRHHLETLFTLSLTWPAGQFQLAALKTAQSAGMALASVLAVLAAAVLVGAVAGSWGQIGVLIAPETLVPNLDKLNPVTAAKNLFSKRKLLEVLTALVKVIAIGLLAASVVKSELPTIVSLASAQPMELYRAGISLLHGLLRLLMGALLVAALIDVFIQRKAHIKSLRMSLEEIIREHKQNEGDPMVKGMRRQIAMALAMSDPVQATGDADAVVVNPTHFAVALQFNPDTMNLPHLLAKGVDGTAQRMIARAHERGIPVIRHVWLARTLYATTKEGKPIPRSAMDPTALIYAVAQNLKHTGGYVELDNAETPPRA
ncbi:EscU/YscU/HrcU family type III secretion system export apparatus switch protein [Ideonella sp. DXS29W]|uniref:EscU/YscU/HrcU family type III secretion system export apparatus switch protein n=1 Tax=Ideonella lacteola TaxID=2984193 RepID=A0ABU9BJ17_9BURK